MVDRADIVKELSTNLIVKRSNIVYQHMRDPALLRYYYSIKTQAITDKLDIAGSSPTEVFVGRWGYPKVFVGPMVPPEFGDTSLLGTPERWRYISMEDIVNFRSKLVRGMHVANVHDVEKGKMEEKLRDLALAERPADVEVEFLKKPIARVNFFDEVQHNGLRSKGLPDVLPDVPDTDGHDVALVNLPEYQHLSLLLQQLQPLRDR